MSVSLHVQNLRLRPREGTLGINIFKYCLGFMGTPIDLLFKPMFIEYIVIMMVQSVVESPLGAAMTVTPLSFCHWAPATKVGLWYSSAGWFPLPDAVRGLFGCHPSAPP